MATSVINVEELTNNLLLELDRTDKMFDRWSDRQVDSLESIENNYYQSMEKYEHTLQALRENERQLEEARVTNDQIKQQQEREIATVMNELEQLRVKQSELPPELHQLDRQHREELSKLEDIRNQLTTARSEVESRQNGVLFGLDKYKALGLEFNSTPSKDGLNFMFTQIDARNPQRQFTFTVKVDDAGCYHVIGTEPTLNPDDVRNLVARLNADQNLGKFVANMRRLFKAAV